MAGVGVLIFMSQFEVLYESYRTSLEYMAGYWMRVRIVGITDFLQGILVQVPDGNALADVQVSQWIQVDSPGLA
jgi:hypothetical protein